MMEYWMSLSYLSRVKSDAMIPNRRSPAKQGVECRVKRQEPLRVAGYELQVTRYALRVTRWGLGVQSSINFP